MLMIATMTYFLMIVVVLQALVKSVRSVLEKQAVFEVKKVDVVVLVVVVVVAVVVKYWMVVMMVVVVVAVAVLWY